MIDCLPTPQAAKFQVPFLGRLPLDPTIQASCEAGKPFLADPANRGATAFAPLQDIVQRIMESTVVL